MNHGENFHRRHLLSTTIANIPARTLVRTALLSVQRLPGGRRSRYPRGRDRSEEHTSELQSPCNLVCRLLLEKKKKDKQSTYHHLHRPPSTPRTPLRAPP